MCGIVGAVARENVVPILIEGIRRLEYRGYDSTGLAVINGSLQRLVSTARVADLAAQADAAKLSGTTGISHTRWATHGAPTPANAHPHTSHDEIAVVHNGIIENFEALRERLTTAGYRFNTQTDSEVIAHLIHAHYRGDLLEAVKKTVAEFRGAYAIAAITTREPGRLVGARAGSPLLVGIADDDHYLASDASAISSVTRRVVYLEEGDVADVTRTSYAIYDATGALAERPVVTVQASSDAGELGPYRHFMQKEIFEQPRAIADTLEAIDRVAPEIFGERAAEILARVDAVHLLACGTSYYAGSVARLWLESVAGLPAQAEIS
ncbi:MAG: isomerizing glutamine--fructose-6-phosphate transaminase, partial [Acidobacteriota bacterium]